MIPSHMNVLWLAVNDWAIFDKICTFSKINKKKRGPVGGNFEIEIVLLQENQTNPASICSMEVEFPSWTVTPVAAEYY